jgi:putative ABC transport system substrate-binding protein
LRDLGYVEGQTIVLEFRSPATGAEQLPGYASELVRLNADVIIAIGPTAVRAARDATSVLPIVAMVPEIRNTVDLDVALGAGLTGGANALVVLSSPVVGATVNSKRIAAFVTSNRLPAISPFRSFTEVGGLMSYGPSILDVYRNTSTFADKILKGAKPADLPIEPPNRYELVRRKPQHRSGRAVSSAKSGRAG